MKHLKLIVDENVIKYDPKCDYRVVYTGMTEPVKLIFSFSDDWKKRVKVASFLSSSGKEYPPQVLKKNGTCIIPSEVFASQAFRVQVLGKDDRETIRTTTCTIYLEGGRV